MISVDWTTKLITIPQAYLTALGGDDYQLDVDQFRLDLKDLEDDPAQGLIHPATHRHNTETTLGGVNFVRSVEIINGYTIQFEAGLYRVSLTGANNNIADVLVINGLVVQTNNSAGLITTSGDFSAADRERLLRIDAATAGKAVVSADGLTVTLFADDGVTVLRVLDVSADQLSRTVQP